MGVIKDFTIIAGASEDTAELIEVHNSRLLSEGLASDEEIAPFIAFCDYVFCANAETDIDELLTAFHDSYQGEWKTFETFVQDFVHECYEPIPEWLEQYIDWKSMSDDWIHGHDFVDSPDGNVFVFRNNW